MNLRIIVKISCEITMHFRYKYQLLIAFCMLLLPDASAQTRIRFRNPDGFGIDSAVVTAYNPFGVFVTIRQDHSTKEFLADESIGRMVVMAPEYQKLDTIFHDILQANTTVSIVLQPVGGLLDEMIISASKTNTKVKNSPVSISVIKPYLVQNKVTADISQVLEQTPGITIADNQVNVRNGSGWSYGTGSRVSVLVDDLPMLSADAASPQFAFMPIENVASIEVVKSAGSVLYGSSALNGVINLRSAEPGDKPTAMVSVFSGVYGNPPRDSLKWSKNPRTGSGASGFYAWKKNRTGITIGWNLLANTGYRMKDMDYRSRLSLRIRHESWDVKGLSYGLNTSAQRGFSGSFLLWENYGYGYRPLDSGYTYTNTSRISIDPFVTWQKGKTTHKYLGRVYLLDNKVDNGNPGNNQSNGSSLWYNEYKVSSWMFDNHLLLSGGLVASMAETHSPLFSGHQTSRNLAAYTQAEWRMRRFLVTAGARYEYFKLNQNSQSRPVFRTGLNYSLARYTNLRASWGQGYRFPSMAEAFTTTTVGALTIFPNPNLKPESGSSSEIGIKQGYRIGNFKAYVDLAAYSMKMHNMMEFTFAQWGDIFGPLFGLGFKSINVADCRISGFEIETAGEGNIGNNRINLLAGYTYSSPVTLAPKQVFVTDNSGRQLNYENTRADSNNYLKYRYKHLLRIDIQVRHAKWETGLSIRFNSAMLNIDKAFVEFPFALVVPDIDRARHQLGSATVLDYRLARYIGKRWKLNFQVSNLTNALYMARPCDLRPPRNFQLQAVWKM